MFLLRRPSEARIRRFLASQEAALLTYPEVGASRDGTVPPGYRANRGSTRLGEGEEVWERGVAALRRWAMYDMPWARIVPPRPPIRTGQTVGLAVRHYGFWSLNACRITYTVDERDGDERRWGFGYGTLPEHGEVGEERFLVELRPGGEVWYSLFSFSRPGPLLARIGAPFAHRLQRRFARESPGAMRSALGGVTRPGLAGSA